MLIFNFCTYHKPKANYFQTVPVSYTGTGHYQFLQVSVTSTQFIRISVNKSIFHKICVSKSRALGQFDYRTELAYMAKDQRFMNFYMGKNYLVSWENSWNLHNSREFCICKEISIILKKRLTWAVLQLPFWTVRLQRWFLQTQTLVHSLHCEIYFSEDLYLALNRL